MNVQLAYLEGVGEPLDALDGCERQRHLLAPPEAGLAVIAVAEADHRLLAVKRAKGAKARALGVAASNGALGDDLRRAQSVAHGAGENAKQGLNLRPCQ